MRYIKFHLDNGFIGCEEDVICAYSADTTDEKINDIFYELNKAQADLFLDDCVDDPSDYWEVELYHESLLGEWEEISEDEYLALVANGVEEFVNGEEVF